MAQVYNVAITCPEAQGIRCPYTGESLTVVAHVCEGIVTYSVPDAFTPAKPVVSLDELYALASRRDGRDEAVDNEGALVDPYSGRRMEVRETSDGRFYLAGGFDPTCATMSLPALTAGLTGRKVDAAPKAESVEHVGDMTPDDSDLAHKAVEDLTEEAGEKMAKVIPGATRGRTTVSMSRGGKRKQ